MSNSDNPGKSGSASVEQDAAGQYRKLIKSSDNNGVASAKPRVITGSDDATLNKAPPGKKAQKDWDINYDPGEMNEGEFRG
ncbi:hypothetical protein [Rhizobium tubonense]|uniref:Uncharacterized protein n=1 Tax=Rhizobium tubonense TaxID=484088 RepID=A0A2W4C7L2_9HYPH|nr:hypothetical protein [Rhizobium tubonense]PZM08941.1 hypothetical protein CPY51_27430 [Rhizobium tubonense]